MRHSYAREKLGTAVNTLATSSKSLKERLWLAYSSFHTLSVNDFSDDLKENWNNIYEQLTKKEPTYNEKGEPIIGKVQNSINSFTDVECEDIAEKIYNLYDDLRG